MKSGECFRVLSILNVIFVRLAVVFKIQFGFSVHLWCGYWFWESFVFPFYLWEFSLNLQSQNRHNIFHYFYAVKICTPGNFFLSCSSFLDLIASFYLVIFNKNYKSMQIIWINSPDSNEWHVLFAGMLNFELQELCAIILTGVSWSISLGYRGTRPCCCFTECRRCKKASRYRDLHLGFMMSVKKVGWFSIQVIQILEVLAASCLLSSQFYFIFFFQN